MALWLRNVVAFLACFIASQAFAAVTLLSPTPQRAKLGETFAPLQVRVTDATGSPVANAVVRYLVTVNSPLATTSEEGCFTELGTFCTTRTDAQGIASTHPLRTTSASTQPGTVYFAQGDGPYEVFAELFVDPVVPPMAVTVVSGANQRAAVGSPLPQPFVVQVLSSSGAPVVGQSVTFRYLSGASLDFNGSTNVTTTTNANGLASASARISMGIGPGMARVQFFDTNASIFLTLDIPYTSTTADGRSDLDLENMWWSGFAENGWGLSIAQRSDRLFPVLYVYDESGNPTWRVIEGGGWGSNSRYENYIAYQYKPKGSPYYAYDASRFVVGDRGPATTLRFHSEIAASLDFSPNPNVPGTQHKAISPMDFGADVPPRLPGIGGMWWGGPSQAGWGISLMEQPGGVFAVWFTYDANGDPTWFVMPTGAWENDTTYSGTLYKTHSSPWFGVAYDSSRFQITSVGTFRYRFANVNNATFEWTAEGHSGSMPLVRIEF
ncbi:hypothetical protein DSM104443_00597 [Usitatibacter rugosus]|uniref:Big-1 domain-containing protein n=1 Tax=Usitatibacter rugosus TaxID=2732067 RepID=A0A6M4GRV2_9PROT|nr:Ig-like domain-containing protein [Usitatibacter rugosus]QJR09548.1 hypothetical protein DSM104443_00597 [Usitatibacter rugosus]